MKLDEIIRKLDLGAHSHDFGYGLVPAHRHKNGGGIFQNALFHRRRHCNKDAIV
jgi:hypothetical protein